MEDTKQYPHARAAAWRFLRLLESIPGSVQAIDYERAHLASTRATKNSFEASQDIRLDHLDELGDLRAVFDAACARVGEDKMRVWVGVRLYGRAMDMNGVSERQAYRHLRTVDRAIDDALVERDMVRAYAGRDLIEATGSLPRGISVWVNPAA